MLLIWPRPHLAQTITLPGYFVQTYATGTSFPTMMEFIGQNDLLVLEKNTGQVKRFLNGVFQGVVLDLAVANQSERGLLGIVRHPDWPSVAKVYVYYSRSNVDGGTWLDNRVESFIWNGTNFVFDQVIIVYSPDPQQQAGPNHDGGYLLIGPDRKLYVMTGDLNRGRFNNPRIEQNTSSTMVADVGGIDRLELNGSTPPDNPFITHPSPRIQKYFCYGFRNGFGMAFDPLTNKLWITENGPDVYDEINYCQPGFNSGWLKLMGPDKRDATYFENGHQSFSAADLIFLPGSHYRDPEFSWLDPVGVTALEFLRSRQFSLNDRNAMIVGDVNAGRLYMFHLNAQRDGLVLFGGTLDKVADSPAERDQHVIGTGFGGIVDIKIGPDGYAYILSYFTGRVYRIRPIVETVYPAAFTVLTGIILSGGIPELEESDNQYLRIREAPPLALGTPSAAIAVEGISPTTSPVEFQLVAELAVSAAPAAATTLRTSLFNFQTNSYEVLDTRPGVSSDTTITLTVTTNASRFIDPATGRMRARLQVFDPGTLFVFGWNLRVDQVVWKVKVI